MAEEIRQVISIDTSGAINSVKKLGTTLGTLGKQMSDFAGQLGKLGKASASLDLKKTADQFNKLGRAMSKLGAVNSGGLRKVAQDASQVKLRGAEAAAAMNKLLGITNQPVKQGPLARLATTIKRIQQAAPGAASAFQRMSNVVKNGGRIIRAGAQDAKRAIDKLKASMDRFGQSGKGILAPIISSFKNFGRVVATQTIVAAFSKLRQAIKQSVQDNIQFVRSIREVGTILPNTGQNMDALANQVRELSDTLNVPLDKAAEGLYQAVSNQIGDAAESMAFLETAAKFAKGAVTDVDTSVKLLSGALNAYGESAASAETYAAQFFTTIKLGRTRASELAQAFGRVAPIASELGVSFAELNAAFATTTIAGISTSESATQIRGALNALLKPTEATKELLAELGYETGEALIQAKGLQGAFQVLRDAASGSITELSKFVPRVRGINFALLATSKEGAKKFEENLRKIESTLAEVAQEKYEFIVETNAERVAREATQIKNLFTVDIGQAAVSALASIIRFTGGIQNFKDVLTTLIPAVVAGIALFAAWGAAVTGSMIPAMLKAAQTAKILTINMSLLNKSFIVLAAAAAAFFAGKYIGKKIVNGIKAVNKEIDEQTAKRIKAAERANQAAIQFENLQNQKVRQAVTERIAQYNKEMRARIKAVSEAARVAIQKEDDIVNAIVNAGEKTIQKNRDAAKKADKVRESALDNEFQAKQDLDDFEFDRSQKRYNELQQFSRLQQRAGELGRKAAEAFARAGTDEKALDRARQLQAAAEAANDEALAKADALENTGAAYQAEQQRYKLLQQRANLEKNLARLAAQEAAAKKKLADDQAAELEGIKEKAKAIADAPSIFDDKGQLKEGKELEDAQKARSQALLAFKQAVLSADQVNISDLIDISQFETDINKRLTGVKIQNFLVSDAAAAAKVQIQKELGKFRLEFEDLGGALENVLNLEAGTLKTPQEFNQALKESHDIEKLIREELAKQETQRIRALGLAKQMQKFGDVQIGSYINNLLKGGLSDETTAGKIKTELKTLQKAFESSQYDLKAYGRVGQGTFEQVALSVEKLKELGVGDGGLSGFFTNLGLEGDQLKAFDLLDKFINFTQQQVKTDESKTQLLDQFGLDSLEEGIQKLTELRGATDPIAASAGVLRESFESIGGFTPPTAYDQFKESVLAASGASATLKGDLSEISSMDFSNLQNFQNIPSSAEAPAAGERMGGVLYRSGGGFTPKGTDTIPAMLSPGEFVVNARSTRRFFSQLQAINAGVKPVYRAEGGPVTNVGDINVNVSDSSGGSNPGQTGRQIARSLRRELRRNTSNL